MLSNEFRILFLYKFTLKLFQPKRIEILDQLPRKILSTRRSFDGCFQKFRSGNENLENVPRGRPKSVSNEDKSKGEVEADSRTNIRGLWTRLQRDGFHIWVRTVKCKQVGGAPIDGGSTVLRLEMRSSRKALFLNAIVTCNGISHDNRTRSRQRLNASENSKRVSKVSLRPKKGTATGRRPVKRTIRCSFSNRGDTVTATFYRREIDWETTRIGR